MPLSKNFFMRTSDIKESDVQLDKDSLEKPEQHIRDRFQSSGSLAVQNSTA